MNDQTPSFVGPHAEPELLKRIIDALSVSAIFARMDGEILYTNQAFKNVFGYTDEDIPNEDAWWLLAFPDKQYREKVRKAWREEIAAAIREGRKAKAQQWRVTCKDGSTKDIEFIPAIVGGWYLVTLNNVTKIQQMESDLRSANIYLKTLVDSSLFATVVFASDRTITTWNSAAEALYGWSAEEVIGRTAPYVPEDEMEDYDGLWIRALEGPGFINEEARRVKKDGTPVDVMLSVMTMRDEHENVLGTISISSDITKKKQTEEILRLTQLAVENISDMVFWISSDGRFMYVNQAAVDQTGYTREELLNMHTYDLYPVHRGREWKKHWKELQQAGTLNFEVDFRSRSGASFPVEIAANLFEYEGHDYNFALVRDITERKRTEEALKLTQFTVDRAADSVYWVDPDARFRYVNDAACRYLGYTREELLSMTIYDIDARFTPDDWAAHWEDIQRLGSVRIDTTHVAKDGHTVDVEIVANYMEFGGEEYNCAYVRDITERKKTEAELRLAQYIVENMLDGAEWVGKDASFFYVNKASADQLGYTREELLQMKVFDIDPNMTESVWPQMWEQVKVARTMESVHIAKDGHRYPVELTATLLEYEGNEFMCAFVRDITERKRTEESLKLTQFAVDNVSDEAYWLTQDGSIAYANKSASEITGYTKEELLCMKIYQIDPAYPPDVWKRHWRNLRKKKKITLETSQRAKDGHMYPVEVTANLIEFGGKEYNCAFVRDITERKKVEDELRLIQYIVENMPDGAHWVKPDGSLFYVNKASCNQLGYTKEELLQMKVFDVDPDLTESIWAQLWEQVNKIPTIERIQIAKDGHEFPVELTGTRLEYGGEEFLCVFIRDITDRKRARDELVREKTFADAVVDSVPGVLYVIDEQRHFARWNKRFEETSTFPSEEIPRAVVADVPWTADSASLVEQTVTQVFAEGGYAEFEASFTTRSGDERIFLFTGIRMTVEDKNYLVGTGVDITERKLAEHELALTNQDLRIVNRLIAATAGIADLSIILDMAAEEARNIVGLEGSTICLLGPDDVLELAAHRAASDKTVEELETGTVKVGECLCGMCAKNGQPLILSTREEVNSFPTREALRGEDIKFHAAFPLMVESKCVGLVCVFTRTDTKPAERSLRLLETAAKQIGIAIERARLFEEIRRNALELEQRVAERTAQLESANKEMEAFSYSVSHDLRAPLRAIDGFSLIILEDYSDKLDEEGRGFLNRIRAAAVTMGTLIDDILRLSRVTRAELTPSRLNLSKIVESIASDFIESQPQRKVEFVIEPDLIAEADPNLIKVALENLIDNAWKFTSTRDVARIEFGAIREEGKVTYYVRDNGVGFDQTYVGKLFTAFQRLHTEAEFPGTGIGLATVKRIIHRHGGEVWAEGEVDKGATFYFTLKGG